MKGEPTCAGIDALKALPDVAVGHRLARVYVGAEIVAGDAVKALRSGYLPLLSGELFTGIDDPRHRGLGDAEVAAKLADRACSLDAEHEGFKTSE